MRILYFADIRFPLERANGIQTFQTCHALARRGHSVTLVVRPDAMRPARDPFVFYGMPREDRLEVIAVAAASRPAVRRALYLAQSVACTVTLRRKGPSARMKAAEQTISDGTRDLHARGPADVVYTRDLAVASALLAVPSLLRPPVVYEAHGFAPTVAGAMEDLLTGGAVASGTKLRRLARRERRVWRRADGYVAITQALADEMASRFGRRSRLAVIPDGTRVPGVGSSSVAVADEVETPRTSRVVAYAGHLYPWKGVEVLLEALAQLPDVEGLIIGGMTGESDLDRLRQRAEELGIGARVWFTGAVPPAHVAALLERASAVVLPNTATHVSSRYTSPLKLFDYMASMRPIAASDLPSIREVLRDGENALLVPPGNAGQLASALRRLLDDRELACRLASTARKDVTAYSWERRAERIETLLADVTGAARAAQPAAGGQAT